MGKEWIEIIRTTGSVGVIGLLFSLFMKYFFSDQIISLLGSEKTFFMLICFICVLFICLLVAIMKRKNNSDTEQKPSNTAKKIKVTYRDSSTHNGDNNF